ncbi:hypothetical protein PQX77_006048 [Marasmius sp. AFHP31]|nr:hypothetical protein PQX77_006048 [Marasmius sp. AFHP31]
MHGIQAEVLLSTYFFDIGRVVEGQYHLSTAVSLAIGIGLHQIRSARAGRTATTLPPPRDPVEEGERINAFWAVYTLSSIWGVALGSPSVSVFERNGDTINTPWPLDMADYEQNGLPHDLVGASTVQNFLFRVQPRTGGVVSSVNALASQASVLLHSAGNLAAEFQSEMTSAERQRSFQLFGSLDGLIDTFIGSRLPPIGRLEPTSRVFGAALLTHTLAYASSMQLHSPFIDRDPSSMAKSLAAAEASVSLLRRANGAEFMPPVMAMLWVNVGRVILKEVARLRRSNRGNRRHGGNGGGSEREGELLRDLERIMETMLTFAESSPLMRSQLANLQELYRSL